MEYRELGQGLAVSAVGLGCMGMSHAYGAPADERAMRNLIAQAIDEGCTFFDTAECYGTSDDAHHNEKLVGAALAPYRDRVVIATKFGLTFDLEDGKVNHDLVPDARPESIRRAVDGSLSRLGVDCIDLYYQHRQDPKVPVEDVARVMADLIAEGKIRHWGLSEVGEDVVRRAHAVCPVCAVQNRYSMMARWYEELFPVLDELGIGYVAFSPLANGLLSGRYADACAFSAEEGDYRAVMPQFASKNRALVDELLALVEEAAAAHHATPAQISLAWMLAKSPHLVSIPGTRKPSRLTENLEAAEVHLGAEEVAAIDAALDELGELPVFGGSTVKEA